MLNIRQLDDSFSDDDWNGFVGGCPDSTLFHKQEWLKLCERHQGVSLSRLGFFRNNELVGVFPLFSRRMMLLKVAASPFVVEDTPYLGPLVADDSLMPAVVSSLEQFIKKNGINFLRFTVQDKCREELFKPYGYLHKVRHTHVLDLTQGKEKVWERMKGRARTAIRKSEKSGITCSVVTDKSRMDRYYELCEKLYYNQQKVPPNAKSFYSDICFGPLKEHSRLITAELDGKTVACAIIVFHKEMVYYLDAVSDKAYNAMCPSSGIQWFVIQYAMENGFKYYDFVGSDMPWIAKFKDSFGGDIKEYSLLEKASPAWIFTLRNFYGQKLKPALQKIKARGAKAEESQD